MTFFIVHCKVPGRKNAVCLDLVIPEENYALLLGNITDSNNDPIFCQICEITNRKGIILIIDLLKRERKNELNVWFLHIVDIATNKYCDHFEDKNQVKIQQREIWASIQTFILPPVV